MVYASRVFLVHCLTRNAKSVGNLRPTHPGAQPCLDLGEFESLGEGSKRGDGAQSGLRIADVGGEGGGVSGGVC